MESPYQKEEDMMRKEYDNKVLSVVHYVHPYVKQRLYIAENVGVLLKNLYASNDIINAGIIKMHDMGFDSDATTDAIKLELFRTVDNYLEELFIKEARLKKAISTNTLLNEEMRRMEESFTIDGDEDYMMLEQLDDISYHQENDRFQVYVFDDHNSRILNTLDMEADSELQKRQLVDKFYHWLPFRVSNIVDLYTFGKLNFKEIAKIKNIDVSRVEKILKQVKKQFRANIE